ncbi:hypothetical protein [Planobispora longispora]|uniref:Uncharacterized protein n=1 Tax=Planobispora longispora TaxID=28887 RepID=A0A8J3W2V7_9ACTN|nr:hypothetical protein [Planobispora longispora]BFE87120.1 hypothetical protein GCM10020093_097210 [Planobispora longispora]GIH74749.1 hypothetical protein Plo01_11780 [Planobispora longispora]
MPTTRQLVLLTAAAGSLVLITLVLLASTGAVSATAAVLFGMSAVLLGAQVLLITGIRRTDGKALRIDARTKRCEAAIARTAAAVERLGSRLDEISELLGQDRLQHDENLRAILASLGEERLHAMSMRQEMRGVIDDLLPRLTTLEAKGATETRAATESGK